MRIGELARRAGLSVEAIRYYERIGVMPDPNRTDAGYRLYDEAVVGRLGFIRAARAVGLTLGQVREVIAFRDEGHPPCALVLDLINARADELADRIAELELMRTELVQLAERARSLRPEDCPETAICHLIPTRIPFGTPNAGPAGALPGHPEGLITRRLPETDTIGSGAPYLK